MKHNVDTKKFTVYRLVAGEKRYVAVPKEFVPVIEQVTQEHGGIEKVPADRTVQGVFLKEVWKDEFHFPATGEQQNDITINQLR